MLQIDKKKVMIAQAQCCLSKTDLAEKAGIKLCQLCKVLSRGTCRPETAGKLAAALGVNVEEILETE